jgi:hypothetical protein
MTSFVKLRVKMGMSTNRWLCSAERTEMLAGTKIGTRARAHDNAAMSEDSFAVARTSPLRKPNGLSRRVNRESTAPSEYDLDRKPRQTCWA